jgi:pyruvate kinase
MNRRTKIVATVGPASWDEPILRTLIKEGVDVVRINFSHARHDKAAEIIHLIRKLSLELERNVAILQDLQGPRIRVGDLEGVLTLEAGKEVILSTEDFKATSPDRITVDYPGLPLDVTVGNRILLDEGLLELNVLSTTTTEVRCVVITGGKLTSNKGINVPNVTLRVPTLTDKDKEDLRFGLQQGVDFVAVSFVRNPHDIVEIRKLMTEYTGETNPVNLPHVLAKIEKHEAITYFDAILQEVDGVMVARGDLGVEMPTEQIPVLQKMIIKKCRLAGKPVITATQMLDSMIRNPRPTRAEVTDVANAILDGTDATMLSGESANGLYPIEAVATMSKIAYTIETEVLFQNPEFHHHSPGVADSVTDAICQAVCDISRELPATAILALTTSGFTARMVARNRPRTPIYVATTHERTARRMALLWGVQAFLSENYESLNDLLDWAEKVMLDKEVAKEGDNIVITGGVPTGLVGQTNLLTVRKVGDLPF